MSNLRMPSPNKDPLPKIFQKWVFHLLTTLTIQGVKHWTRINWVEFDFVRWRWRY
jgi:hypothetical protein